MADCFKLEIEVYHQNSQLRAFARPVSALLRITDSSLPINRGNSSFVTLQAAARMSQLSELMHITQCKRKQLSNEGGVATHTDKSERGHQRTCSSAQERGGMLKVSRSVMKGKT